MSELDKKSFVRQMFLTALGAMLIISKRK